MVIAKYTGLPIRWSKTTYPTHIVHVHGIEVDPVSMTVCLPADKLSHLWDLLASFARQHLATLNEWQSFIGMLSFAWKVIHPGHLLLRHMFDAIRGVTCLHLHIKIMAAMQRYCAVWLLFLLHHNGISYIQPRSVCL